MFQGKGFEGKKLDIHISCCLLRVRVWPLYSECFVSRSHHYSHDPIYAENGMRGAVHSAQGQLFYLQYCWPGLTAASSAQLWVPHSHLLACRTKHTSKAQPEPEAKKYEETLLRADVFFFCPSPCSPRFCKICVASLGCRNPIGPALFCRQSAVFHLFHHFLQSCIYFAMFSKVPTISPVLLQHLAQGGPDLTWAFALQKYSLSFLLVFVNCNTYTDCSGNMLRNVAIRNGMVSLDCTKFQWD